MAWDMDRRGKRVRQGGDRDAGDRGVTRRHATTLAYRLTGPGTAPIAYAAEALCRVDAKGRVRGNWTDSSGRTRPIGGRIAGSEWHNLWGSADFEIGRSTYVLEAPDRLIVTDSVLKDDGSWRVFATLSFQRKP